MRKTVRWYNSRWFYLGIVLLVIFGLYFAATNSTPYFNWKELVNSENTEMQAQIDTLNKKYEKIEKERAKIVIVRERITTKEQEDRIAYLEEELRKIRILPDTIYKKDSPQELYKYFKDLR